MKTKIITIEDVTKIVGISNYIKALNLDKNHLIYQKYEIIGHKIKVYFAFEEKQITILINKEHSMIDMDCSCHPGLDYCPHIALAVMYLINQEEMINKMFSELNKSYDEEFNQKLLKIQSQTKKEEITLEIHLKQIDYRKPFEYELQVKIGKEKKYVLKKQLHKFFEVIQKGGSIIFGQNFTYDTSIHQFSDIDQKIISFLKFYYDAQNNLYHNYYAYHSTEVTVSAILLKGESLIQFLKQIESKPFTIEIGYYIYHVDRIRKEIPFSMQLSNIGEDLQWKIEYQKVVPITEDNHYVWLNETLYEIENIELINLLLKESKSEIIIKKSELPLFANNIIPKIKGNALTLTDEVKKWFPENRPTVKYYFEKDGNDILAQIHLIYEEIERDIYDEELSFNGKYIIRNKEEEQKWKQELKDLGFIEIENQFRLYQEDKIVAFLESNLKKFAQKYEVYISKELKNTKWIIHPTISSSFSLGKDAILNFAFQVENLDQSEIEKLWKSIKQNKKYYRLKNGDYLNLEDEKIKRIKQLDEQYHFDTLTKYQMIGLQAENYEFIHFDDAIQKIIKQFYHYRDQKLDIKASDLSILRDYQITGVQWMMMISKCGFGGILADEMGLGKSLQTIEYIKLKKGRHLIIVPTSLLYNWQQEFQKFAPDSRYILVSGTKEKRIEILKDAKKYDVFITTYGLLRQDISYYETLIFDTCVLDEAQNIKNITTETSKVVKKINYQTGFALTGTPLENSVLEIWSIFDFLMPGFLPNYTTFKKKYNQKSIEENKENLESLNDQISPFILRRKKREVLKELPDKIETNLVIDMTEEQKKLYITELVKTKEQIASIEEVKKNQILILSLLTKLRQICIDPNLIVKGKQIPSAKKETLLSILKEAIQNGHKILVFSQFPSALREIETELKQNQITFYYLDGNTKSKKRIELVDAFNQDKTNVFLISLKAGGTGLNLTSADVVVHLDPWWNPQVENQATDRSHRIGQKKVVEVIKLIARGTIEEKIVALQEKKKQLSEQVVEGKKRSINFLSTLTEEDLRNLLLNEI